MKWIDWLGLGMIVLFLIAALINYGDEQEVGKTVRKKMPSWLKASIIFVCGVATAAFAIAFFLIFFFNHCK